MFAKPPSTFWQEAACSRAEPSPGRFANTQEPNCVCFAVSSALSQTLLRTFVTSSLEPFLLFASSAATAFAHGTY